MFVHVNKKQKFPSNCSLHPGKSLKNIDFLGPSLNLQKQNLVEWGSGTPLEKYPFPMIQNMQAGVGTRGAGGDASQWQVLCLIHFSIDAAPCPALGA